MLNCEHASFFFEMLEQPSENGRFHNVLVNQPFQPMNHKIKLLFEDAKLTDVVIGRAIRTIPADGEQPSDTVRRALYDECNFQIYSLIYRYRTVPVVLAL